MTTVGAYEAKTRLSELLERVAVGEEIIITKHGHPVAVLAPVTRISKMDRQKTVQQIRDFSRGRNLDDHTLRELIEEGRRF
jgi:prevent-host-death family protein